MSNWPPQGQVYSDYALPASKVCTAYTAPCDFSVESACMLHAWRTSGGHASICVNISAKNACGSAQMCVQVVDRRQRPGQGVPGLQMESSDTGRPRPRPLSVHDRTAPTRRRVLLEAARRISCQDWVTKEICRHTS